MKRITIYLLILLSTLSLRAGAQQRFNENLRLGDIAYNEKNYYTAVQYYLTVFDESKATDGQVIYPYSVKNTVAENKSFDTYAYAIERLAECYRMIYDYANAEKWYAKAVSINQNKKSEQVYWYGVVLRNNSKFEEAAVQFKKVKEMDGKNAKWAATIDREIANCTFAAEASRYPKAHLVENNMEMNAQGASDYGYTLLPTSNFIFTTTRYRGEPKSRHDDAPFVNKLVYLDDEGKIKPLTFANDIDPEDKAAVTSTPDGKRIYYTTWRSSDDKSLKTISMSYKINDSLWSKPFRLPEAVNAAGKNARDPYMWGFDMLFFASDRSGGQGGYDLWSVKLNADGQPAFEPVNLGSVVNSKDNEVSPFVTPNSTLYYSSTGFLSLGGYDVFQADYKGENQWNAPRNIGYPINSSSDDVYYMPYSDSIVGLVSSDRDEGCCYNVYDFTLGALNSKGLVVNSISLKSLDGIKVYLQDSIGARTFDSTTSTAGGKIYFPNLDLNRSYRLMGKMKGYEDGIVHFNTTQVKSLEDTMPLPDLRMFPNEVGQEVVIENIFYDFDKATLRPESKYQLDILATELKKYPDYVVEISSHTDSKGTDKYNFNLSDMRAKSVVDYLIAQGVKTENLVAKGYGETMPRRPNKNPDGSDNPENRQINRRTEFKILKSLKQKEETEASSDKTF